jgi:hypothetical protein
VAGATLGQRYEMSPEESPRRVSALGGIRGTGYGDVGDLWSMTTAPVRTTRLCGVAAVHPERFLRRGRRLVAGDEYDASDHRRVEFAYARILSLPTTEWDVRDTRLPDSSGDISQYWLTRRWALTGVEVRGVHPASSSSVVRLRAAIRVRHAVDNATRTVSHIPPTH